MRAIIQKLREHWNPPAPGKEQLLLAEASAAREEMLCLLSQYNEVSSRSPHFTELVYRLMASEKRYQIALARLRRKGIGCMALPYYPSAERRGISCQGCWYGW